MLYQTHRTSQGFYLTMNIPLRRSHVTGCHHGELCRNMGHPWHTRFPRACDHFHAKEITHIVHRTSIHRYRSAMRRFLFREIFANAQRSPLSVRVLDRNESLVDWNPTRPRYNLCMRVSIDNAMRQYPPHGCFLLVITTT
ncbi:hypothetical protein K470DRAFT_110177 [Piedraia hortae CBS 480.64]|uniref:Uncharacterized protein n=1 Tax=Piedraia hortae CBS 480.64 TaxID=1314780 RepID=A0A6A7BVQ2_9PEZI|nr:hypothetical protein K470DRAFT_110177 [Piedraia hortae CBS 480.64]